MNKTAEALIKRHDQLVNIRAPWESHWQDLVDFILPRRGDIHGLTTKGARRGRKVFDSTATHAAELLAAALHGMLTSPAVPWFSLYVPNYEMMQDYDIVSWLEDTTARIHYFLAQSNFVTRIHEHYLDLVVFGTAYMYIEGDDRIHLNFVVPTINEMYLAHDKRGIVDTVHRQFKFTARQIIQTWGIEKAPTKVMDAMEKEPDKEFDVLHVVMPRKDKLPGIDKGSKPFASYYLEMESKEILDEGGYDQQPYLCPRWHLISGEVYGRSPGMTALSDIKTLQQIVKTTLKAAQKAVDPPLQIPDNMVLTRLKMIPGGTNFYRAGSSDRIEPMPGGGAQLPVGFEVADIWRQAIRRIFLNDQLQLGADNPQMTATEVIKRSEDQLRVLGPVSGRLQPELLEPLIDRVFHLLSSAGKLLPTPPALKGMTYDINYVSPIAKAQKQQSVNAVMRFLELASPFAEMKPEVLDGLDTDKMFPELASDLGVPKRFWRKQEEVDRVRQERAEQMKAAQAAATAQELGRTAKNVGSVDPENLRGLADLMGLSGAGGSEPPPAEEEPMDEGMTW